MEEISHVSFRGILVQFLVFTLRIWNTHPQKSLFLFQFFTMKIRTAYSILKSYGYKDTGMSRIIFPKFLHLYYLISDPHLSYFYYHNKISLILYFLQCHLVPETGYTFAFTMQTQIHENMNSNAVPTPSLIIISCRHIYACRAQRGGLQLEH